MTTARRGALLVVVGLAVSVPPAAAQRDPKDGDDTADDTAADKAATSTSTRSDGTGTSTEPATIDPDAPLAPPTTEVPTIPKFERIAAKGFFSEAGIGAAGYLGSARGYSAIGPSVAVRVGYYLVSRFSFAVLYAS